MKTSQFLFTALILFLFNSCVSDLSTNPNPIDFTPTPSAKFRVYISGKAVFLKNQSFQDSSWHWDFGNGQSSNLENPDTVLYDDLGTYTITLTVKNGEKEDTHIETIDLRWERMNDFPGILRSRPVYFEYNEEWYYGLGQNDNTNSLTDWWKYDPKSDSWTSLPPAFFDTGEQSTGPLVSTIGNQAYLLTRKKLAPQDYSFKFRSYNISTKEWAENPIPIELDSLLKAQRPLNLVAYNDLLFLNLDQSHTGKMLVIKINPEDMSFETEVEIACNGAVNYYFNAHLIGTKLYLVGSRLTFLYDLDSKTCFQLEGFDANSTRSDFNSIVLDDETFIVMGGIAGLFDFAQIPVFKSMQTLMLKYQPISKSVEYPPGGYLPIANAGFALFHFGDEVIMVGGSNSGHYQEVWKYFI